MSKITDRAAIAAVLAYCRDNYLPCWAIRTPPESTIGGFSCELLAINGDTARVRIANGDEFDRPMAEIHLRAS